jgi:hypothetical protein
MILSTAQTVHQILETVMKGCERKLLMPDTINCPQIGLERMKKITKVLKIA